MISIFGKLDEEPAPLILFNTLGKKKEEFKPIRGRYVKMYTCGPTVYDYAHIGNLRAYIFADILRRTLEYLGYEVKQVINITDVGHLQSDADDGEDKMTNALKREGLPLTLENMKLLADRYASTFVEDMKELNVRLPFVFPRASEHIPEQIAFIKALFDKGYAYIVKDGVYFDTSRFAPYGILGGTASADHSRLAVHPEKRHPSDFALWKFNEGLGWDAPWGKGFPGWHIECTAMSTKYLGKSFDIHTGGIDHIPVHHNNEIAQAEAATGKKYVNYWLHGAFATLEGKRIGKSEGNAIRLYQLRERGVSPLAYRYLLLTSHYRSPINFTWEALEAAQTALYRAQRLFADYPRGGHAASSYRGRFEAALKDDLNTAAALSVMWDLIKDDGVSAEDKRETLLDFDRILAIGFSELEAGEPGKLNVIAEEDLPEAVARIVEEREAARREKRFADADRLRDKLKEVGYSVEDNASGPRVRKAD